jgi:hypothetical protein
MKVVKGFVEKYKKGACGHIQSSLGSHSTGVY